MSVSLIDDGLRRYVSTFHTASGQPYAIQPGDTAPSTGGGGTVVSDIFRSMGVMDGAATSTTTTPTSTTQTRTSPTSATQTRRDLSGMATGSTSAAAGANNPVAGIAAVAYQAGWRGDDLIRAVAIALAESRGNPEAIGDTHINPGTGEQSTGLWQIHYRPSRDRNNPTRDPQANLDPLTNARNAYRIFQSQGWRAWSVTHGNAQTNNNHYSRWLGDARQASMQLNVALNNSPNPQQALTELTSQIGPSRSSPSTTTTSDGGAGGGITTTVGGGGAGDMGGIEDRTNFSDAELNQIAREEFGGQAWMLEHDELGPIMRDAVREQWTPQRFTSALQNTSWWEDNAESIRQWQHLEESDPATARQSIDRRAAELSEFAMRLGIPISSSRITELATSSLRYNWNDQQVRLALVDEMEHADQLDTGEIEAFRSVARSISESEYFLPMSESQAEWWGEQFALGHVNEESVRNNLRSHAMSRYPDFVDQIQAGLTPRQIFDPYIATASELLEIPEATLDPIRDPRLSLMHSHVDDDGQERPMTMSEWQRHIRSLDDYAYTERAHAQADQLSLTFLEAFGRRAV